MESELIERLARLCGVGDAYYDYHGQLQSFGAQTKSAILRAMGEPVGDRDALAAAVAGLQSARARALMPPLAAANGPRIGLDLNVTAAQFGTSLLWSLRLEDGTRSDGVASTADLPELWGGEVEGTWMTRRRFELPPELPPGYHELEARIAGGARHHCLLIVSPARCFEPPAIAAGRRLWGVSLQLYTIRSRQNWGIGDFNDLQSLIRWFAARGAGFIGLNPLHALFAADPSRASPYSASDRHFLNVLYIAVPAAAEYAACAAAQALGGDAPFERRIDALRGAELVDYRGVAALKFEVLALLHRQFRESQIAARTPRAAAFHAFVAAGGTSLQRYARFEALDRHFRRTQDTAAGWMSWPQEYRDPDGAAAAGFAAENPEEVEFFLYLQWLADQQLRDAQSLARRLGMPIGLYGDYAVGADGSGAEIWADRGNYRLAAQIGAPPDRLAQNGQGWGIPPPDPQAMQRQRLQGFVRLIRANMRHYGALRLDHVMALFRLWWVPAGASPAAGAYVHYPLQQLATVLALESARAECLVVGEDLGVVPEEVRAAMAGYGLYHYKVMWFEKENGGFRRPEEYPRRSLASVTTHDLPTIRGYWEGLDIELRERLKLYPHAEACAQELLEREADRGALLAALRDQGIALPAPARPDEAYAPPLAQALHRFLARSGAALAALQLEDLLGMSAPVNVPGTNEEYPNWRRKMSCDLEDIFARAELAGWLEEIDRERA
ncbi:MAG TPA: 4-alpha-glucanotransferase [Steroidobacteraceae bacterium]|nr:4-alpha-glucanotransferase [Steroidobacteraceae bacterium]